MNEFSPMKIYDIFEVFGGYCICTDTYANGLPVVPDCVNGNSTWFKTYAEAEAALPCVRFNIETKHYVVTKIDDSVIALAKLFGRHDWAKLVLAHENERGWLTSLGNGKYKYFSREDEAKAACRKAIRELGFTNDDIVKYRKCLLLNFEESPATR